MVAITALEPDKMLLTIAASLQMISFQPASGVPFENPYIPVRSAASAQFTPSHVLIDNKLIKIPYALQSGIDVLNSLMDIGRVCLKDSRDITAEESAIVHAYIKKKYRKIQ